MTAMTMKKLPGIAALAAAAAFAGAAHAQVFKCVDASGRTVYLQSPCPSGSKSSIVKPPPPPAVPSAKSASPAEREREFRKRQREREEAEKNTAEKTAESKQTQEACQRAREQLAQYTIGGRISRINAQGERYYLGDDEVEIEQTKAHAIVAQNCK